MQCLLLLSEMPLKISGEQVDKERLYDAVHFLLNIQSPTSGGLAIWERPVPQPYLEVYTLSYHFKFLDTGYKNILL